MKSEVRIIGGLYRGKKIPFPPVDHLRPTPDRVRETLFNWLMHDIRDAKCLDAFAGSGALGFEALSRGAAEVLLLDSSREVFASLQKNSLSFKNTKLRFLQTNALIYFENTQEQFDIIFLDPPFAGSYLDESIELLQKRNILRKDGLLYVESPHRLTLNADYWTLRKSKKAGLVFYALFSS